MSRRCLAVVLLGLVWLALRLPTALALEVPYLTGRVTDEAEILSPETRRAISARLQAHEAATSHQVAVLTVPSLDGEGIEEFALRVFDAWQLGRKGEDNGVLLVVAPRDRRMRIEVGYGLEGRLTDLEAGRIVRGIMAPRFKAEDFNGGISQGVEAILAQLAGGDVPLPEAAEASPRRESFFQGPELPIVERLLFGAFIFGIIGLFTVIGVMTPGAGWFLYFFLIPFWAMFPIVVVGTNGALTLLVTYLLAFPLAKIWLSRRPWYHRARQELLTKGRATIGGFTVTSGGRAGAGAGSSSGGGGFSGGGGRSGGGGASGSW